MRINIISLFLMLLGTSLCAETRTYLVFRKDNFPQDRYLYVASPQEYRYFVDSGKKTLSEAGGQPFRLTSYEISYDGKYALWTVTFKDESERWHLDSIELQGYAVLLRSMDVISVPDPRGGLKAEMFQSNLATLPTDFYQIQVSTQ